MSWEQGRELTEQAEFIDFSKPAIPVITHTANQLELFQLAPQDYLEIEKALSVLPRKRQREHLRKLYIREYHSVKAQGEIDILFNLGISQRNHANAWLREVLENRLDAVFAQYRCNLSWVAGFNMQLSQWKEIVKSEIQRQAKAEQSGNTQKKNELPFYLLTQTKLKEIADKLAIIFSIAHRAYFDQLVRNGVNLANSTPDAIRGYFFNLYIQCGEVCEEMGFPVDHWQSHKKAKKIKGDHVDVVLCKLVCKKYWFNRMRKVQAQMVEHLAIACGEVRKGVSQYISDQGFCGYLAQVKKNHDFLKTMIIENIDDPAEQAELFDMYLKSSSNPGNLRQELMTRLRGLEEWAEEKGNIALFLTLTAPSAYHAVKLSGELNKKYNGSSPKQTQAYLNRVWQQFRALLKKRGIAFYGMRVAEPHHDATPHWHAILYIQPQHQDEVTRLFQLKALEEDGDEKGADVHRCKVDVEDKTKGSATGYISKYISKNINGFALEGETSDEDPDVLLKDNAKRARAWASTWHIRQFQFYGDKFVSLWRELRRLASQKAKEEKANAKNHPDQQALDFDAPKNTVKKVYPKAWQFDDALLAKVTACADVGDYAAFVSALVEQGFLSEKKDVPLCLYYEASEPNRYEQIRNIVKGVKNKFSLDAPVLTRLKKWCIKRGEPNRHEQASRSEALNSGHRPPRTCVSNCNLENEKRLREKIQEVLKPICLPLHEVYIKRLLIGKKVILNHKQSLEVINNEVILSKNNNPVPFIERAEDDVVSKLWELWK